MHKDAKKTKFMFWAALLIVILGLTAYFNSLGNEFIWDDAVLVRDNLYIRDASHIGNLFLEDIAQGANARLGFWRPLQMLTYMWDYASWGLAPAGYHLTNISVHIFTALLIYWLANTLFANPAVSLLAGVLFAVHPVHTETVAYISGRAESLAALFMLLAYIFYIKALQRPKPLLYLGVLLSAFLAVLSKEYACVLPLLLLVYHYVFRKRLRIWLFLLALAPLIIIALFRMNALASLFYGAFYENNLFRRIPGFFAAVAGYLRLLFFPVNLHMDYGNQFFSLSHPLVLSGLSATFLLLFWAHKKRNSNKLITFCVHWFFVALLPVSGVYPMTRAYMAEHWVYVASVGFFIVAAYGLYYLYTVRRLKLLAALLAVCAVSFYTALTIKQNTYWKDRVTFYEHARKFSPHSLAIANNLCGAYVDAGKPGLAVSMCKEAISINPFFAPAYCNLGNAYKHLKQSQKAIAAYEQAVALEQYYEYPHLMLGDMYLSLGDSNRAIQEYKKALSINPRYALAYVRLGDVYAVGGRKQEALDCYQKAKAIDPHITINNALK